MKERDRAIVLHAVRHGDRKFIVRLFTAERGLITALAVAGSSKSAKIKASHLLPLTLLEVNLSLKQNREIAYLTEANCYFVSTGFTGDLVRLSIAQLISETLIKCLREQGPAPELFSFLEQTVKYLNDAEQHFTNLHLYFLRELSGFLGFEPQNNFSASERYFDCREGRFHNWPLSYPLGLGEKESEHFSRFLAMNVLQTPLSRQQRQELLEAMVAYYSMHVPGFDELKSVSVLREVLD